MSFVPELSKSIYDYILMDWQSLFLDGSYDKGNKFYNLIWVVYDI